MNNLLFIILCIFITHTASAKHEKYTGYAVYDVIIRDQKDNNVIAKLRDQLELDVWTFGSPGLRDASVMVASDFQENFLNALVKSGMKYKVREVNVVSALNNFDESCSRWSKTRNNPQQPFTYYARLAEIDGYMEKLAKEHPNVAQVVIAGLSTEGRPIKYLKISTTNFEDPNKPIYFLDSGMHSREWVTQPVALYVMHRLVENLLEEDKELLNDIDWIILPVYNPDGYEYTHTNERMWRKNRSFNATRSQCYGVDLNRNFDIFFGENAASNNPCSDAYSGPYAFSEIENRHVRDILHTYVNRIQTYVNIHSYGSYVLYGFDNATLPVNAPQIHQVGATMGAHIDALKLPNTHYYNVGNSKFVLYAASGTSQDYAQNLGIPFSFTLELPDFNKYGFLVPPQYISQINKETYAGIAASAKLSALFYKQRR